MNDTLYCVECGAPAITGNCVWSAKCRECIDET